jgi:hypothetical protein
VRRGLELRDDVAREGVRWITVGAASQPGVAIVLTNYLHGSLADGDAIAALVAKGALNGVHFHTDDLDATFEKVRASGAEIVQEPTEQPWGTRDCAVRDPSGNLVRIDQPPARGRDAADAIGPWWLRMVKRGAGGARTHDRRIMRSTAPCAMRPSCADDTNHCTDGASRAGII